MPDEYPSPAQIVAFFIIIIAIIVVIAIIADKYEHVDYKKGVYFLPIGFNDFTNRTAVVENAFEMDDLPSASVNIVILTGPIQGEYKEAKCFLEINGINYEAQSVSDDDTIWVYKNFLIFVGASYNLNHRVEVKR